jgi:cytosine/creatinine deaminase
MTSIVVGSPGDTPHLVGTRVDALARVRRVDGTSGRLPVPDGGSGSVTLDADGWLAIPAPAEPHAHLDKALTAARLPAGTGHDLPAAVAAWKAMSPAFGPDDVTARALAAVGRSLAHGTTAIRTHVDVRPVDAGDRLAGLDALVALRDRLRGTVDLQLCLLPNWEAPTALIDEAVDRGVDVLGGCPHLAPDPRHEVTRLLDVAERTGLPVDLHADERLDGPDRLDVAELADQVLARGLTQQVTASHVVRLGVLEPAARTRVIDRIVAAGIGVVTNPITNLYLQARDVTHRAPRGLTAVRDLLAAGVPVAAGADNLRDPFNPVGRADAFETTSLLVTAAHLTPAQALAAVTTDARRLLGIDGGDGDLVLVPVTSEDPLGDALAGAADARIVVHRGRVVADTRCARTVDLPELTTV